MTIQWSNRRGAVRDVGVVVLIALCVFVVYRLMSGGAGDMVTAFLRRVRAMGQP
jgi:hypothetical protein